MVPIQQTVRELRASRHLMSVTEWEIQQLLLDIHDGPVQYMYAALSQLDLLRRAVEGAEQEPSPEVSNRLDRIRFLLESGLRDVRTFIGAFRAPEFESRGLLDVLESLLIQYETATDLEVALEVGRDLPEVDLPIKISLYRVLQEALANAHRHGGASEVRVRLERVDSVGGLAGPGVRMKVADDGAGFEPGGVNPEKQFGLHGMQDRVEMVGGAFSIQSVLGSGTQITVEVPLA